VLKVAGSVCVLSAGVLALCRQIAQQRQQRRLLRELAVALEAMCGGIRVGRMLLPRLLQAAGRNCQGEANAFFVLVQARSGELGIEGAWKSAAELLTLDAEEKEILKEAGNCLAGDEEQLCAGLLAAAERLRGKLEYQQRQAAEKEKRTAALCMSASALIIILLI